MKVKKLKWVKSGHIFFGKCNKMIYYKINVSGTWFVKLFPVGLIKYCDGCNKIDDTYDSKVNWISLVGTKYVNKSEADNQIEVFKDLAQKDFEKEIKKEIKKFIVK